MNLYRNHLSYIVKDGSAGAAINCSDGSMTSGAPKRHAPGQPNSNSPEAIGHRIYKMFACFDFEAILDSSDNQPMGHATIMVNRHRAISVHLNKSMV